MSISLEFWCDKSWLSLRWHMVLKWHSLRAIWSLSVLMLQGTPSGLVKLEEPGRTDGRHCQRHHPSPRLMCYHFTTAALTNEKLCLSSRSIELINCIHNTATWQFSYLSCHDKSWCVTIFFSPKNIMNGHKKTVMKPASSLLVAPTLTFILFTATPIRAPVLLELDLSLWVMPR